MSSFASLGLNPELLRAIHEEGYDQPTPIQLQAIPSIIQGKDVMASAQTGTGKTAAFTLPILHRFTLVTEPRIKAKKIIRVLILTPTRELALQVGENVKTYGKYLPYKTVIIFGGVKMNPQISDLRHGTDILVATPGRLLDLAGQGFLDLSQIETLVLDEADRMLDMGFANDMKKVFKLLPEKRQNLLFSATFSQEIRTLANQLMQTPISISVSPVNSTAESVTHIVHPVDRERKRELLSFLITSKKWQQVLVFTRTKHGANRLAKQLETDGITCAAIHGNKGQGARIKALADFKSGKVRVLVATDIAARGLDIDKLPHVVNFDLPNVPQDYVHRIGRTGRAQNEGEAVSLVCIDELGLLRDIESLLKEKLKQIIVPGYQPDPNIKPEPIRKKGPRPKSTKPIVKKTSKPRVKRFYSAKKKSV